MLIATFTLVNEPKVSREDGYDQLELPLLPNYAGFQSTLEERIEHGRYTLDILSKNPVDFIFDTNGYGLLFVEDPREKGMSALLHHALGVPLVSHFWETIRILFRNIDAVLLRELLQSPTWHKGIFTQGHLEEMKWMRIPGCFYLPMYAPQGAGDSQAISINSKGPQVFFAGSQQSLYFAHADGVDTREQWPGALALAALADGSASTFLDVYQNYELGLRPSLEDNFTEQARRVQQYFSCKMFYSASRNLGTRDRFVIFLKKKLGDKFLLIDRGRWNKIYNLPTMSPVDYAAYTRYVQETPICLNVVNGDNETGLNARHFEITALGGFLLSYNQPELADHFDVGRECEAFRSEKELEQKIDYYLAHPEERNAIAQAGRQRTLNNHLRHHRVEFVVNWLRQGCCV